MKTLVEKPEKLHFYKMEKNGFESLEVHSSAKYNVLTKVVHF